MGATWSIITNPSAVGIGTFYQPTMSFSRWPPQQFVKDSRELACFPSRALRQPTSTAKKQKRQNRHSALEPKLIRPIAIRDHAHTKMYAEGMSPTTPGPRLKTVRRSDSDPMLLRSGTLPTARLLLTMKFVTTKTAKQLNLQAMHGCASD